MDEHFKDRVTETLRYLMAEDVARTRLLRALVSTHPDPAAMRDAWLRYSANLQSNAALAATLDPKRRAVMQAELEAFARWTSYLAEDLSDGSPPPG